MLLVRHNRLLPPYDTYEALSWAELDALATGGISPDIQPLPETLPFDRAEESCIREADRLICSEAVRTQQTARAVLDRLSVQKEISIDPRLNEIEFLPSALTTAAQVNPLQAVRDHLYPSILAGTVGAEPLISVQTRIEGLLTAYEGPEKIVLFTHGFLIRLIKSYVFHDRDMYHALNKVSQIPAIDYLQAVRV